MQIITEKKIGERRLCRSTNRFGLSKKYIFEKDDTTLSLTHAMTKQCDLYKQISVIIRKDCGRLKLVYSEFGWIMCEREWTRRNWLGLSV